jgi:hypothetical protein
MRRVVRFVGPARPKLEATEPQASSESPPSRDSEPDRPLDVTAGRSEQMPQADMVDAVAREA